jgi:acyl-coenzyme A thioesterase PaaI-like protein
MSISPGMGDGAGAPAVEGPDAEGFIRVAHSDGRFNDLYRGVRARKESHATSRVRIETGRDRTNNAEALHGGFMLAFIDHAIFMGPIAAGRLPLGGHSVTLSLSTQFLARGRADVPLDCVIEIVSETGRLMFVRGQLEQEERVVLTFHATLRKIPKPAV